MTYLLVSIFALSLMILLMPLVQRLAIHIGAVDHPGERKVHKVPVPRIGGVLIAFTFLLTTLIFIPIGPTVRAILVGSLMISAMGLTDDLIGLNPWIKFAVQWLVAGFFLGIAQPQFDFPLFGTNPWLTWPVAGFFIVFMINAINLQDGLDGLASGLVIIGGLSMGMYLSYSGEWQTVKILAILAGAVLGFLRVNARPARIFMGDSGSYLLGFILAAVFLHNTGSGRLPWWSALFFFAIPLGDTVQVMLRRALAGGSIFKADKGHLHHLLLGTGLRDEHVVYAEYMLSTLFALVPILILSPLRMRFFGIALVALLLLILLSQKNIRDSVPYPTEQTRTWFDKIATPLLLFFLIALFGIELVVVKDISIKYGVMPIALAGAYSIWSWLRLKSDDPGRISITLALIVGTHFFLIHQFGFGRFHLHRELAVAFYVLAGLLTLLALILFMRAFRRHLFFSNTIEYLLVFGSILLLFLPVHLKAKYSTDLLGVEMLVFFFVFRVFSQHRSLITLGQLHLISLGSLLLIALRGTLF